MSRRFGLLLLTVLATLALAGGVAEAQAKKKRKRTRGARVRAKVISVRGDRIYLERRKTRKLEEAFLRTGTVRIRVGRGKVLKVKLLAVSSKYLVLQKTADLADVQGGEKVLIGGRLGKPPRRSFAKAEKPTTTKTAPIQIGRAQPTRWDYTRKPEPKRELVPFRGLAPEADPRDKGKAGPGAGGKPGDWTVTDEDGNELTPAGRIANQVKGEVVVGVSGVYDQEAEVNGKGISRTTPYARLRLEVRQLGGSDRASFTFYGSARHPFNEQARDWTGNNKEQLDARLTHLVFEIDAEQPEKIQGFTDRIELAVGRSSIPSVVQAGLVDGARFGMRFGPVTAFAFGGFAASPNPRREDFDSIIYGGGVRFETSVGHKGALKLSFAGAQEQFREDGERDFFELNGSFRWGAWGVTGSVVADLFDTLRDDEDLRLTTGYLNVYAQVSRSVRLEAGYRETRPQWQAELLQQDLDPLALVDLNRKTARRNMWSRITLRLPSNWTLWLRGEHYQEQDNRDTTGGAIGVSWRVSRKHRVALEMALRHRRRGDFSPGHTTDPFVAFSYQYSGEKLMAILSLAYRDSLPNLEIDDRRVSLRVFLDYDIAGGFGVRGHAELDFRRDSLEDGVASFVGLAARYRF